MSYHIISSISHHNHCLIFDVCRSLSPIHRVQVQQDGRNSRTVAPRTTHRIRMHSIYDYLVTFAIKKYPSHVSASIYHTTGSVMGHKLDLAIFPLGISSPNGVWGEFRELDLHHPWWNTCDPRVGSNCRGAPNGEERKRGCWQELDRLFEGYLVALVLILGT